MLCFILVKWKKFNLYVIGQVIMAVSRIVTEIKIVKKTKIKFFKWRIKNENFKDAQKVQQITLRVSKTNMLGFSWKNQYFNVDFWNIVSCGGICFSLADVRFNVLVISSICHKLYSSYCMPLRSIFFNAEFSLHTANPSWLQPKSKEKLISLSIIVCQVRCVIYP